MTLIEHIKKNIIQKSCIDYNGIDFKVDHNDVPDSIEPCVKRLIHDKYIMPCRSDTPTNSTYVAWKLPLRLSHGDVITYKDGSKTTFMLTDYDMTFLWKKYKEQIKKWWFIN